MKGSFINTDDIITYKEDDGIIYGYFNQEVMDNFLYNRAKENSHNFTDKDQIKEESFKRPLTLDDISTLQHSISLRAVQNDEFVSEGNALFDIDLKYYEHYFSENNISDYNTLLYRGVTIFSKYSGYYTGIIKDDTSFGVNLGNRIKDGDLLFTIQSADKLIESERIVKDVRFDYDLIPRQVLEKAGGLSDLKVSKYICPNYTFVKEGDDVLEISKYGFNYILKSPYSGLLVHRFTYYSIDKLTKGTLLFSIYPDVSYLKSEYPYVIRITKDDFTKKVVISCEMTNQYKWNSKSGFFMGRDIYFNFENVGGKYFLLLRFKMKDLKIDKLCSLHLLLDSGNVISLTPCSNPIEDIDHLCKYELSPADIDELAMNKFIKWRITNAEGVAICNGENICCLDRNDNTRITKELSYDVFGDFINDFRRIVKENISPEDIEEIVEIQKTCYVYLMIDTTNHFYKIGISNRPKYREHTLQSDKPTIELLCAKEYPSRDMAEAIEAALHKVYANKRIRGEWFNLNEIDIENIKLTLK